jgi:phosphoribosyl-ATP pyrophosphohydrolase/phosphoribosyl-AMP cyclohydrolase
MKRIDMHNLKLDSEGLIPVIVQDVNTHQVLMMAYMNRDSLSLTLERKETYFWSRSRNELWHKGETSGNIQKVIDIRVDCDADTLLILVEPAGPACHTGEMSCFYRSFRPAVSHRRAVGLRGTNGERSGVATQSKDG